ncbi:hypothetical protein [Sansalvadorimonas verongulae]|uniref:hypothetical protein n=1 Tax=Sansalvadorimonas verongulae TaxID=2172824 RepID=UPI0012BB5AB1|nr:hypothetical protein [Sansalvadorimonas verongulae]MTI12062.1 hypothetical protein [Sansalvadorimonas verongulae]
MDTPLISEASIERILKSGDYEEAYSLLQSHLKPGFKITLDGPGYNGNIPYDVVKSLQDTQNAIMRAYCLFTRGTTDIRLLSREEKHALKMDFSLSEGSAVLDFVFQYTDQLLNIINETIKDMDSEHKAMTIISLFGFLFMGWGIHALRQHFGEKQRLQARNEEGRIQQQNMAMIGELVKDSHTLARAALEAGKGQAAPLLAAPDLDEAKVNDVPMTPAEIKSLREHIETLNEEETRITTGDYYVDGYIANRGTGKKATVVLTDPVTYTRTQAEISGDLFSSGDAEKIKQHMDTNTAITLQIEIHIHPKRTQRIITDYIGLADPTRSGERSHTN